MSTKSNSRALVNDLLDFARNANATKTSRCAICRLPECEAIEAVWKDRSVRMKDIIDWLCERKHENITIHKLKRHFSEHCQFERVRSNTIARRDIAAREFELTPPVESRKKSER
jgi:hypothetical protein